MAREKASSLWMVWLLVCLMPVAAWAQGAAAQRGRLLITVADPSGAIVESTDVTLVGLDTATKAADVAPRKTDAKGVATFEGLVLGRYSVRAEFPGFELGLLRDIRVNRGDNKHIVVLPLKGISESVTVEQDKQEAASSRASLGSALTREQLDQLSDDPDEMRRQLDELAGPNATIRVDSFEGQNLPPKSQIKAIHITRDQYAAENHYIGGLFIDIITQPGIGPIRTNMSLGYNSSAMNGRTAFTPVKGPEANRNYGVGFGGTIIPRKLDAAVNVFGTDNYTTPSLYLNTGSGLHGETLSVKSPTQNMSVGGTMNWAVTRDQTLRFNASVGRNRRDNEGLSGQNQLERAYKTNGHNFGFLAQEAGPLGRRFFFNTRMRVSSNASKTSSRIEAPTITVNEAFTQGGAQRAGETRSTNFGLQSDLDYVRGRHSWRTGVQVEGSWFHSDDTSNYLGTYTFTNLDAYLAGRPTFYSRRVGDPTIEYSNIQVGFYVQDDIRVSKTLTLSPGLRYELQTHVSEYNGFAPRFGFTWSPFKSGKTSIRGGGGISYDWLSTGTYAQTVRLDGFHQLDLNITNPNYPDPGDIGTIRATNRYLLGSEYVLPRNVGMVIGVSQQLRPRVNVNVNYQGTRSTFLARGRNLNAPVNGVRPDPSFLNVIETVSDGQARSHVLSVGGNVSVAAPSPSLNQARFNWKRMSFSSYYSYNHDRNNIEGAFGVPASGTLDTEWAPRAGSVNNRLSFSINSSQVKNLNVNIGMNTADRAAYNITTGLDDNGDLFFNDRPFGVSRNSARYPDWTRTISLRLGYNFQFGKANSAAPQGIALRMDGGVISVAAPPPPAGRYRVGINVFINNLTNRSNYGAYNGNMASSDFGKAFSSGEPRRIQVNVNFGF